MNITNKIKILEQEVEAFNKRVGYDECPMPFIFADILANPTYQQIQGLLKTITDNNLDEQALADKFELLFLQFQFLYIVFWRLDNDDFIDADYEWKYREGIYLYKRWKKNEPISSSFKDILQDYMPLGKKREESKLLQPQFVQQRKEALQQLYTMDKQKTIMWLSAYLYKGWKLLDTIIKTLHENGINEQITTDDVHNILLNKSNPKLYWYVKHYFLHVFESWDDRLIYGESPIELHAWLKLAKTLDFDLSDLFLIEQTSTLNENGEMVSDWSYLAFIGNERYQCNQETTTIPTLTAEESKQAEQAYQSLLTTYQSG